VDWARLKQHNDVVQLFSPPSPARGDRLGRVDSMRSVDAPAVPKPASAPLAIVPPVASTSSSVAVGGSGAPQFTPMHGVSSQAGWASSADSMGRDGVRGSFGETARSVSLPAVGSHFSDGGRTMSQPVVGVGAASPWDKLQSSLLLATAEPSAAIARHVEGWMAIQGHFVKSWKTRWFVLQGRQISYFANQVGTRARAVPHPPLCLLLGGVACDGMLLSATTDPWARARVASVFLPCLPGLPRATRATASAKAW
jgi:hypothetical protein